MKPSQGREYLIALKQNSELYRQGITFRTSSNTYLYDSGTGKVARMDKKSAPIITALFDTNIDGQTFEDMLTSKDTVDSIVAFLQQEHLLMRPAEAQFYDWSPYLSEEALQCQQLIIELTGKCNLRCKYCVYNDHYEQTREFNDEYINFSTAKKAIDYAYKHRSPKFFAVGFYGGEPLLNFKIMKECIDYCLSTYKDVSPTFSFTTNLTLMTVEIAEYLAQIPNMSIIVSMDGPQEIQNQNRTFANGAPTYDAVYRGLKTLCDAIRKFESNCQVNINCVFMPPYTEDRFSIINSFFESLTFLPQNSGVTATYPSPGSIPDYFMEEVKSRGYSEENTIEWMAWSIGKMNQEGVLPTSPNIYSNVLKRTLGDIHHRTIISKPTGQECMNACCIPGNRRLYVCTDGSYKLCEKMGDSPFIGNVDTGLDFSVIRKYYIEQYEQASLSDCTKCWAIKLCNICYSTCYGKDGINIRKKRDACLYSRQAAQSGLQIYHEVLEKHPEIIEQISRLERS